MHPSAFTASPARVDLINVARQGDRVMLLSLAGSSVAAWVIGQYYGQSMLALTVSALLMVVAACAFTFARGRLLAAMVLTTCNVAAVALHIQLGRGTLEFHFGVFVLLGMLMVYRDWRPIVLAAALFAVHHVLFDRLQALDLGVYCTPEANLLTTMMHAIYVVVQTGIEIFLSVGLRRAAIESAELSALVRGIDRGEVLCLDVEAIRVRAPSAVALKQALGRMAAAMADVNTAATSIEGASSDIAAGNLDFSRRTDEQASQLQHTASSMEQLTGTVGDTAATAVQATQLAGNASAAAVQGGVAVHEVVKTMADIGESSRRIADINSVIDGIAFQTNILALNAAVEAARAGEQGRGFAVVAAEVRTLAQRSAAAAKEIKTLISDSVSQVERGSRQVGAAGASMDNIVEQARRVSQLIQAISGSSAQQSLGITQVGKAVTQLDSATQQNAALVEQGAAAADSLKQQARRLNAVVQRFSLVADNELSAA